MRLARYVVPNYSCLTGTTHITSTAYNHPAMSMDGFKLWSPYPTFAQDTYAVRLKPCGSMDPPWTAPRKPRSASLQTKRGTRS